MASRAPVVALVLAAGLWGVATSGTKFALSGFGPLTLLAVELGAATTALWITLLIRGYRPPSSWRVACLLGLLEPALAYLGDTIGLDRTSASNASLIFGLESTFVVLLAAVLLHERITPALAGSVLAGLLGLVALEGINALTAPHLGDVLVLCGAVSAACYTILARHAEDENDTLALTAHQFAFASLIIVPTASLSWISGSEPMPAHVAARFWIAAVLVGIAGYAVSFILYNWAITVIEAGAAGVIINLIPAFALASAVLWLGESLTRGRMIGALLIASSVAIFSWTQTRASARGQVSVPVTQIALEQLPARVLGQ
jgi:O-acetylserine/cysteine efflux transporter